MAPDHLRRQLDLVHGHDLAVDLDHDGRERGEEEVGRLLVHHQLEQRFDVHLEIKRAAVEEGCYGRG